MSAAEHITIDPLAATATPLEVLESSAGIRNYFDIAVDPADDLPGFNDALNQLNPRFQGARELVRWELEADQTQWPDEAQAVIMGAATRMRMLVAQTPLVGNFDVVIGLGAARQANLDRARYAAGALAGRQASTDRLILAGSSRVLNEAEQANVANYAPDAKREIDLVKAARRTVKKEFPTIPSKAYFVDNEKAGTPEVIESVLAALASKGRLPESPNIAAVTTQIYSLSTGLDLQRVARRFGAIETWAAGNPSDPKIVTARTPSTYLSEVLRTMRAAAKAQYGE